MGAKNIYERFIWFDQSEFDKIYCGNLGAHLCRGIPTSDYIFAKTAYINLMQRIFDNIDLQLFPALKETLQLADRADFCVGYLNLRGWKQLDS